MALLFYNLFIHLYFAGILIVSLFSEKAHHFIAGRKKWRKKLRKAVNGNARPLVWFHCASLGEFEQARPVIEAFKTQFPSHFVLLTFFSPSGYELRKNYKYADYVSYLPIDSYRNAKDFIAITKPEIVYFVKYEFWHYYSKFLAAKNIPLISFSTIFREEQVYFQWYGAFYRKILKRFKFFFLQDDHSATLMKKLSIENFQVSGDTRFDRVWEICKEPVKLPVINKFKGHDQLFVIGSCWPEDLDLLTSFINSSDKKFIIAPHEITEKFIQDIEKDLMGSSVRYSKLDLVDPSKYKVLIIDNIGMLSSLYSYGEYAYVGGGFGRGLHNILEPATFGIPVFFGNKNYQKFKEARDLTNLGGAAAVGSYDEFRMQFQQFSERNTYEIACKINQDYVVNNLGATDKIINYTKNLLEST